MSLLVISHTEHYVRDGVVVGWGPTIRELDYLANLFGELVHIAPIHKGDAPASAMPYTSERVRVVPVVPGGGATLLDKTRLFFEIPSYVRIIRRELRRAKFIHVRCPANISLVACLLLLGGTALPGWAKYAGNWQPRHGEVCSYAFQRYLLKYTWKRGPVTVNGTWPGQPGHVHAFLNPSFSEKELIRANRDTANKSIESPVQLLFVGRMEEAKGILDCLEIFRILHEHEVKCFLSYVGDGPARGKLISLTETLKLSSFVRFLGWLPRQKISAEYAQAHFLLHPSVTSEGWPKVLSESMAFKVIPLAYNISAIAEIMNQVKSGLCFDPGDNMGFVQAIKNFQAHPEQWKHMAQQGQQSSALFTYEKYIQSLETAFRKSWGQFARHA